MRERATGTHIRCANDHAIGNGCDDCIGTYRATKGTTRSARSPLRRPPPSSRPLSPRPCQALARRPPRKAARPFVSLNYYSRPGRCFALVVRRPTGPTSMKAMKTRLNEATNPNGTPTGSSGAGPAAWRSCLTRRLGGNALPTPSCWAAAARPATKEPRADPGPGARSGSPQTTETIGAAPTLWRAVGLEAHDSADDDLR